MISPGGKRLPRWGVELSPSVGKVPGGECNDLPGWGKTPLVGSGMCDDQSWAYFVSGPIVANRQLFGPRALVPCVL